MSISDVEADQIRKAIRRAAHDTDGAEGTVRADYALALVEHLDAKIARLRHDLEDPPGDVQELVLKKFRALEGKLR